MEEQGKGRNKLEQTSEKVWIIDHLICCSKMLSAMQTFLCEAVNDLFALSGIVHMHVTVL